MARSADRNPQGGPSARLNEVVVGLMKGRARRKRGKGQRPEREREVLALMAEGRSNQAICDALFLAPKTVETHIANLFPKLGARRSSPSPQERP